jgi:outer membrane protein TolC
MKKVLIFLPMLMLFLSVRAQNVLTLEQALQLGLKNNFDIQLSQRQSDLAHNSNFLGNAGFLPLLETDGSFNQSVQNTNQTFATGLEQSKTGAKTTVYTGGIELDWTVFDGLGMFAARDRLQALDEAGMLNFRNQVEQSSATIISGYFDLVRQQQQLKVTRESIRISGIRLDLAKTKFEIGSTSKLDYLQAKSDMNADSTTLLQQIAAFRKSKRDLNYLIGKTDTADYQVADTIILQPALNITDLENNLLKQNNLLLAAERNQAAANAGIDQAKSLMYPKVGLVSRYNFTNQNSQVGLVLINQTAGLNYGATARWNIFNGTIVQHGVQAAKIQADIARLNYDVTKTNALNQLDKAYEDYVSGNNIVNLVRDNMQVATQNLDIAGERYRIGKSDILEYRQAQLTYIDARNSLLIALYNAKAAETELLRLAGEINKAGK